MQAINNNNPGTVEPVLLNTCLITPAETLLRTKDCCTHSVLHAQQDALTQYKDHYGLLPALEIRNYDPTFPRQSAHR
jgi:hypothetical protein